VADKLASTELDGRDKPPDARPPDPSLKRGDSLGRYTVLERLGGGSMGVVYSAYDPELDRKLALKILRPDAAYEATASRQARLLREAQAMARLAHQNVIAVHDVGLHNQGGEDRVFVAMELVDGATLRHWLGHRGRPIGEVLEVFIQAGRGLAAAHAVGLVHRDFKPDNVLIGSDRVRVCDFGLARASTDGSAPGPTGTSAGVPFLGQSLTHTGSLLGTPAYMSPEQFLRQPADARSDQFSFCVALYEALYGERPFRDGNFAELAADVTTGKLRDPPREGRVPARLRQAILRGLSVAPADRWPSMDALLSELARFPSRARARWLWAGGALIGLSAALAGALALERSHALVCRGAERKLDGVWDAQRRQGVRERFAGTGLSYADDAYQGAARAMDRYARAWANMHTEACEATRVRGEQSEELLDLRMECLAERREELRAAVELFSRADAQVVKNATRAASALGSIGECADAALLKAPVRPPSDPATRAKVDQLHRQLATARALYQAGKFAPAIPIARATADEAHKLGYAPLEAEALLRLGQLQRKDAQEAAAEESLVDAAAAAVAGRDDAAAARAWTELLVVVGLDAKRAAEASRWDRIAEASLARASTNELRGDLAHARAVAFYAQGREAQALAEDQRSLALYQHALAPDDPRIAASLTDVGADLIGLGRTDEALTYSERALDDFKRALGPAHPDVSFALINSALLLSDQGRFDDALARLREGLAIRERALGSDHPDVAAALLSLAEVLDRLGRYDEAMASATRALGIYEAKRGPEDASVAWALHRIGEILLDQRQFQESLARYRRALAIWEKALEPDDPRLAYALTGIGRALTALHDPRGALAPLERARVLREGRLVESMLLATTRFALARALAQAGVDRERAHKLAEQARDGFHAVGGGWQKQLAEVEAWLAR
jgi:tetratricopeptide (TPR) repeat protein